MRWEAFLDQVQEGGEYATPQEAERAARTVLALLGAHLVGEDRAELASRLPETFALILLNPLQATEPLPPERFLQATAAWIEGATEQKDVSAVLSVTADAAGLWARTASPPSGRPDITHSSSVTRLESAPSRVWGRIRRPAAGGVRVPWTGRLIHSTSKHPPDSNPR